MFKGPPVDLICPKDLSFPYVPGHLWVFTDRFRFAGELTMILMQVPHYVRAFEELPSRGRRAIWLD